MDYYHNQNLYFHIIIPLISIILNISIIIINLFVVLIIIN